MNVRDFLTLADSLSQGKVEAEWRTAVSRAYYAAFHFARDLLSQYGFTVPRADRAHSYLWLRLANSGHEDVQRAGGQLDSLRRARNQADYDVTGQLNQASATVYCQISHDVIRVLESAIHEPIKTQVTDAIRVYELDVLRDVTWHP
jgi:uncharacterized protein (UPF0332 family)